MVDKAKIFLKEWMINFIKHKDIIANNLVSIEDGNELKAIYQNKEDYIVIEPFVKDFDVLFGKITKDKNVLIVLFNTIENFEIISLNWKRLIDFDKLTIYFVNMFSNTDTKWIIKPYLHNKITDEKSLKSGLSSMFAMVEPITEQEVLYKISQK